MREMLSPFYSREGEVKTLSDLAHIPQTGRAVLLTLTLGHGGSICPINTHKNNVLTLGWNCLDFTGNYWLCK